MNPIVLKEKISEFLKEDLGFGDLSVAFLPGGTPYLDHLSPSRVALFAVKKFPRQLMTYWVTQPINHEFRTALRLRPATSLAQFPGQPKPYYLVNGSSLT